MKMTSILRSLRVFSGIVVFSLRASNSSAVNLSPVTVTGFNRDVVIENTSTGPPFSTASNLNSGENTCFYQTNLPGTAHGLPLNGQFVNTNDGTLFQFAPYSASNALVLSSDTGLTAGTLTLATPVTYSRIAVIAHSGNGDTIGSGTLTLRFNDNTTLTTNYYAPDWFNNSNASLYSIALQGFERKDLTTGNVSGNPGNPRLYQTTINLFALAGATNKPLASLTFGKGGTGKSTAIYAISGLPTSAVTLAALTNAPASNILSSSALLLGGVTSVGDETPLVTIFYGTNNGGTVPSAWSNSVSVGYQSGAFSQSVSGLTPGRTYFFTSRAANAAGAAWATPSLSFSTPIPTLASITNLPATSVSAFTATLNGKVTNPGGDIPSVTIFYGPSDGLNNPAAWAQSISLGLQSGAFSANALNLSSNVTYYFTARAQNVSGTSWATPSQSFVTSGTVPGPAAILTQHNDNSRSGDNLKESTLNVANVNTNTFGLVCTRPVDDQVYAQPLVATNVSIPGKGVHNIVLIATVNDSVYAYDADDSTVTAPYWQTNYTGSFSGTNVVATRNTDMTGACGGNYMDYSGGLGIVGTPAIDPVTKTMYFVVRTKETSVLSTNFVQRLYAVDIATGTNRMAPTIISGSFAGVTFDSQRNNQRSAIGLANGTIYIAWSSHCDWGPYHGWVMAYNAGTLTQSAIFCDTPTGSQGGIWMSGQGPAIDGSGNIYVSTGNGTVGAAGNASDPTNRAMSFLKLNGSTLSIMSWFTPYNYSVLNGGDWDLGAGGLLLIPGTSMAIGGGKSSSSIPANLYLVNRDLMGGVSLGSSDTNIIQAIPVTPTGLGVNHIHGAPVWWAAADGSYIYVWGESDHLHQYRFDSVNGVFQLPAVALSPTPAWVNGMTGGMLAVSANGTNAGTGILWASHQFTGDANQNVRPGILHAYDAQKVSNELWNSEQFNSRDSVGKYAKFVPPTVANGKVYLATFSGRVNVYGILPIGAPVIYKQPTSTTRFTGEPLLLNIAAGGSNPLGYQWKFNNVNLPGATNASLYLPSLQYSNGGNYTCVLSGGGSFLTSSNAVVTVLTAPTISYAQAIMADAPVAYWRLNETNGVIAHDYAGGHDGQYFNVSLGLPGYSTNDWDFAAGFGSISPTDSYVGNIQNIDFSTYVNDARFSIEAWVNGGTQVSGAAIVTFGYGAGGEQFDLDTGSGGAHAFRFSVRDAINQVHNANSAVAPNGTWQHVVGVCDEPGGFTHLYVNGVDVADATISGGIQMGTAPITIGSRQSGFNSNNNLNFFGSIDEVAIYNYALTSNQVSNHYAKGLNPLVTLCLTMQGNNAVLNWSPGVLQAAPNVNGPYTDVPGATAPYITGATNTQVYYRVRVN